MLDQAGRRDVLVGQTLGHYDITGKVGAGGMGDVYRAHDRHLDREVAIKVLSSCTLADEASRKRFHKEAHALSKLNHPNIATIYDFNTQDGLDFLVMEYILGVTLNDRLAKGALPEKQVISLGTQLAEGLIAAHEHGVIHRDLKPANLRLTNDARLKILDFGLAQLRLPATASAVTETLNDTNTNAVVGTLPYMAPEQLLGEAVDARTDIHAAGLVLYEMATGRRAFAELPSGQLIGAIVRHPPIPPRQLNHKLSAELERIIEKCLEKDPENRYQSAKELAVDLRRLAYESQSQERPAPVPAQAMLFTFHASWRVRLAVLALTLLALALLGARALRKRPAGSVARGFAPGQSFRRSFTRVFCRWHDRRTDHAIGQGHTGTRDLAPVGDAIQRHEHSSGRDCSETEGRCGGRGIGAAVGKPDKGNSSTGGRGRGKTCVE